MRFVEEILGQMKKWHRSLLGVSEDATFESWCKKHPQGTAEGECILRDEYKAHKKIPSEFTKRK